MILFIYVVYCFLWPPSLPCASFVSVRHTHMYLTIIFSDVFERLEKKFPPFNINHTFGIVFDYNLHLYVQLPSAFLPPYTAAFTSTKCHMYYLSSIQFFSLFWLYLLFEHWIPSALSVIVSVCISIWHSTRYEI